MAKTFRIESLSKSPAKFNEQQLLFWQTQAINNLSEIAFWNWTGKEIECVVPEQYRSKFIALIKPNIKFPLEVKQWAEALFNKIIDFNDVQKNILKRSPKNYFSQGLIAFEQYGSDVSKIINHLKEKLDIKGKELFQPLRIALTLHEHGPDLASLLLLINPDNNKVQSLTPIPYLISQLFLLTFFPFFISLTAFKKSIFIKPPSNFINICRTNIKFLC